MLLSQKNSIVRHAPYPAENPRRVASATQLAAQAAGSEGAGRALHGMSRNQSAPARLNGLDTMAKANQKDMGDAAYFAPAMPTGSINLGAPKTNAVGLNGLSLKSPSTADASGLCADMDRGGMSLTQERHVDLDTLTLNATRNLGGTAVGGALDAPFGAPDQHVKGGLAGFVNGPTVGFAPNFTAGDGGNIEVGVGVGLSASAQDTVRVLNPPTERAVAIESKQSITKSFAFDPRVTCTPAMTGVFFKFSRSFTDEIMFRLTVTRPRAGTLLTRQAGHGPLRHLRNMLRQWNQVLRQEPCVRQPDINDPFGKRGGKVLAPGQELARFHSETEVFGGGLGIAGLRAGAYHLRSDDDHVTVRCLDASRLSVTVANRSSTGDSHTFDAPIGPVAQKSTSQVTGDLKQWVFDHDNPADAQRYDRLMGTGSLAATDTTAAADVSEISTLQSRDDVKGIVRVPMQTSWGAYGQHRSTHVRSAERRKNDTQQQLREVATQVTRHALAQGVNSERVVAVAEASSVQQPKAAGALAFRGLKVTTEQAASRPDAARRNHMAAEHGRLWRKDVPSTDETVRTDYKAVTSIVFSGRQLHQLECEIPERAASIAQALGACPNAVKALIGDLRAGTDAAGDAVPFARAWLRSVIVSDYLQEAGSAGLAALHRLLGGVLEVSTHSSAYEVPLLTLADLTLRRKPSIYAARKLVVSFQQALRALRADAILRAYDEGAWSTLCGKLEQGLGEATVIAEPRYKK